MKKNLLVIAASIILALLFVVSAGAEEEWVEHESFQVSYSLPAGWEMEDPDTEDEMEVSWFTGDIDDPEVFLAILRTEFAAMIFDMFTGDIEEEGSELLSDTTVTIGGMEGRTVHLRNEEFGAQGWMSLVENVFNEEGIFIIVGAQEPLDEEFAMFLPTFYESIAFLNE